MAEYCLIFTGDPLPEKPDYPGPNGWIKFGVPLAAGQSLKLSALVTPPINDLAWKFLCDDNNPVPLVVYGAVRFNDGFGTLRQFGFLRKYDSALSRLLGSSQFVVVVKDGYNYTD